jgi:hypothetical protein
MFFVGRLILRELQVIYNNKLYIFLIVKALKYKCLGNTIDTAGNRHKQNSRFCKEIREYNFRFWWRRVHEDADETGKIVSFQKFQDTYNITTTTTTRTTNTLLSTDTIQCIYKGSKHQTNT